MLRTVLVEEKRRTMVKASTVGAKEIFTPYK